MHGLRVLGFLIAALLLSSSAFAGGAWIPEPWKGDIQLGFSQKTANTSWNASGDSFHNTTVREGETLSHYHNFRYAYFAGELGLVGNLSFTWTATYLYGLEGAHRRGEERRLLRRLARPQVRPDAGGLADGARRTERTPILYDLPGAYNRYLFDAQGNRRGVSPEWRGLLKHDYTLTYLPSHSFYGGRGWMNFEAGYTWREGAPADQMPVYAELGYPLPWWGWAAKGAITYVRSQGNDSPRQPDDRFGSSAILNFNDASLAKASPA